MVVPLYNDRAARSNRACAIRRDQSAVLISPDRAWSRLIAHWSRKKCAINARSMRDQARSMRDQCAINARSGAINARSMRDQCAINARSGVIRRDQKCAINARSMRDQYAIRRDQCAINARSMRGFKYFVIAPDRACAVGSRSAVIDHPPLGKYRKMWIFVKFEKIRNC